MAAADTWRIEATDLTEDEYHALIEALGSMGRRVAAYTGRSRNIYTDVAEKIDERLHVIRAGA